MCVLHAPEPVVQSLLRHDVQVDVTCDPGSDYDAIVEYGVRGASKRTGYQAHCFMGLPATLPRIWIDLSTPRSRVSGLNVHRPGRWFMRAAVWGIKLLARFTSCLVVPGLYVTVHSKTRGHSSNSVLDCAAAAILHEAIQFLTLYSGSIDQKRKITVRLCLQSGRQVIAKVADTAAGKAAVLQESAALKWLSATEVASQVPQILGEPFEENGAMVQFQSLLPDGRYMSALGPAHLQFLKALRNKSRQQMALKDIPLYRALQKTDIFRRGMEARQDSLPLSGFAGAISSCDLLEMVRCLKENEETLLEVGFSHGDFAPWNCSLSTASSPQLFVYDWEDADPLAPAGIDVFHFLYKQAVLVGPWEGMDAIRNKWYQYVSEDVSINTQVYLAISLLREFAADTGIKEIG